MYDSILIRYGELALKGKNRKAFMNALRRNIKEQIKVDMGFSPIINDYEGRWFLDLNGHEPEEFYDSLNHVFGIYSYSPVRYTTLEMDDILQVALEEFKVAMGNREKVTFRVTVKRVNKNYEYASMDMAKIVAEYVSTHCPTIDVDLKNYDIELFLEIRNEGTYVMTQKYKGLGGLPLHTGGKGMLLLSGGIDSPVAGWYSMRRGVTVEAIHFHSYPYTSEEAKEKVLKLAEEMALYSGKIVVHLVPFTKIQEEIAHYCHDNMRITIMRRIMVRIAEKIALERGAMALITGDNLGQVASQTMESIFAINEVTTMPILRPLICMDKEEITIMSKKIGTYETSILPYEDCCTVFVPKDPKTKPKVKACHEEESKLDIEALVDEAVKNTEMVIKYGKVLEGRVESETKPQLIVLGE